VSFVILDALCRLTVHGRSAERQQQASSGEVEPGTGARTVEDLGSSCIEAFAEASFGERLQMKAVAYRKFKLDARNDSGHAQLLHELMNVRNGFYPKGRERHGEREPQSPPVLLLSAQVDGKRKSVELDGVRLQIGRRGVSFQWGAEEQGVESLILCGGLVRCSDCREREPQREPSPVLAHRQL